MSEEQIKNLPKTDLIENIIRIYWKKVMALEILKLRIELTDNSLRNIIKNDKIFFKNEKFSRTEYEKFLIKSGITAPQFEANIAEQEKRRQFLSSLSGGIVIPEILVKKEFRKENQSKTIQYIDLEKYHSRIRPSEESKKELYERNKNIFFTEFKKIRYAEITPDRIIGDKEFNETFFKQLDVIENNLLDGQSFDDATSMNNESYFNKKYQFKKKDKNKNKIENLSDKLFKNIYNLNAQSPEIINIENKYYIAEISNIKKENKPFNDPDVQEALKSQISFKIKLKIIHRF